MFGKKEKTPEKEKAPDEKMAEKKAEAEMPKEKKEFTEVDPKALISVPVILCPMCGLPMEIKGREEVEKTARSLRGKATKKIPHLVYQCPKDKTEFKLNLERRGGGGCFIATAAYGSSMAHEINVLRSFRDNVLMRENAGRKFISFYYRFSPTIAKTIEKSRTIKLFTRMVLTPIVKAVQKAIQF